MPVSLSHLVVSFSPLAGVGAVVAVGVLFLSNIALKILFWVALWQEKEYRTDRMLDFLATRSGKQAATNHWSIFQALLVIFFIVLLTLPPTILAQPLFLMVESATLVLIILETALRFHFRVAPLWTMKAIALAVGSMMFALIMAVVISVATTEVIGLLCVAVGIPFLVTGIVLLTRPVTQWYYQRLLSQAAEKMQTLHPHPIVIGIAGSFGKTSTKEFLRVLLGRKYRVLATPKHVNVDVGIAQVILRELTPRHEVFIVEMGAYRRGEIQSSCQLVRPQIGILTGLNNQHIALFGNGDNIKRAKGELLEALPPSGLAVVNSDSPWCMEVAETTSAKVLTYSTTRADVDVFADHVNVSVTPRRVTWTQHHGSEECAMQTSLAGRHVIPSLLAASAVARALKVPLHECRAAIAKLRSVPGTMDVLPGINRATIIDDHYNSNPDGFFAALDYLALFEQQRKIVITRGMIELGGESEQEHRRIGQKMGSVADFVIVTKKDFAKPLTAGVKQAGLSEQCILVNDHVHDIIRFLQEAIQRDTVVLVEGRIQQHIFQALFP